MSVGASDLVLVGCQYHAEDDSSTQGGSMDTSKLLYFSTGDISAADEIEAIADDSISATITITGRNAAGAQISEALAFSAEAGPKTTTAQFERVEKAVVTSGSIGASVTVTLRKEADDVEILKLYGSAVSPSGAAITEVRKLFLGATIPASGSNTYYEKAYFLNAHATLALDSPVVSEYADPDSAFTFGIEAAAGGTRSVANRLTAPTGITFDNANKSFTPATLAAGAGLPVWLKLTLSSAESSKKSSVTMRLDGRTV